MTNEQKYKTTNERFNAFYKKCGSCRVTICDRIKVINCLNNWLTLEAEEEKLEPCPFCGGETHINLGQLKDGVVLYWVDCISPECMYRSAHYTDKDAAISAHNRVCRAVEAMKKGDVK